MGDFFFICLRKNGENSPFQRFLLSSLSSNGHWGYTAFSDTLDWGKVIQHLIAKFGPQLTGQFYAVFVQLVLIFGVDVKWMYDSTLDLWSAFWRSFPGRVNIGKLWNLGFQWFSRVFFFKLLFWNSSTKWSGRVAKDAHGDSGWGPYGGSAYEGMVIGGGGAPILLISPDDTRGTPDETWWDFAMPRSFRCYLGDFSQHLRCQISGDLGRSGYIDSDQRLGTVAVIPIWYKKAIPK